MGFHGPPKRKAKKSDGFWRHGGRPKILAHLTLWLGDEGAKKERLALTNLGE